MDSLVSIGREAHLAGDFARGQAILNRALEAARRTGDSMALAEATTWLGQAARRLGDYAEARRLGERALELKRRSGDERGLFDSYNALGLLAWEETRLEDAAELYDSAQTAAVRTGDSLNVAKVAANRALVHLDMGNFRDARAGLSRALTLARRAGDDRVETLVLLNLATLDEKVGHPTQARDRLVVALDLGRRVGDRSAEAYALGELAVAYQALGEPGTAFAYMDSALAISRDQGNRQDEAENLALLAGLHRQAGRYRRALELLGGARALHQELSLIADLASDLKQEAEVHALLGNLGLARQRASEALEAHTRVGIRFEKLADLLFLADLAQRGGDVAEVEDRMERARDLAQSLDARTARIAVALTDARLHLRQAKPAVSLEILDAASADLALGGYGSEAESAALRARALAELGRLEEAARASAAAIRALERTRQGYGSGVLRASFGSDRSEVYVDRVAILVRLGRLAEAYEAADGARGRALLERLALVADGAGASPTQVAEAARAEELLGWIDTLVVRLEALELAGTAERGASAAQEHALLSRELERTRADYDDALIQAAEANRPSAALLGVASPSAAAVRGSLSDDELLLEYFVTPDSLYTFALRRDTVQVLVQPVNADDLRSRVRVARELVARPESSTPGRSAVLAGLDELLLEPVRQAGAMDGVTHLHVVPHEDLTYLPFAALRRTAEGPFLIEQVTLSHLPSGAALPALRDRDRPGAGAEGPVGVSFAPFPRELPGTAREVEAVRNRLDGWSVRLGIEASESALREALGRGSIVHAATHGILNAWNPIFSRILLERDPAAQVPGDGRLELHEVVASTVDSPLVFLSGCETGVGVMGATGFVRGEDYATLAQAFLYAGADNVVATLWRILDDGAAAFAEAFFSRLARSGDPARALADAQRAMLTDPRYSSPFYWAGYRLDGRGEAVGRAGLSTSARPALGQQDQGGDAVPANRRAVGHRPSDPVAERTKKGRGDER